MDNFNEYIPINEKGKYLIQPLRFNSPSKKAKSLFFYPLWGGEYYVKHPYSIDRKYMDSFIIFWIEEGIMTFDFEKNHTVDISADKFVILDCKQRNHYYTDTYCKFMFFHFNGQMIQQLYDYLIQSSSHIFTIDANIKNLMNQLMALLKTPITSGKEIKYSKIIYNILVSLNSLSIASNKISQEPPTIVQETIDFINIHYPEKIMISDICYNLGISKTFLSNKFHQYTNKSIHNYIISVRLIHAKHLLVDQKNLNISEIADLCGFHDSSHLNKLFISVVGMSPSKFRKMQL